MHGPFEPEELAALNQAFRQQVEQWDLHYRCRHCGHLAPLAQRCSLGYPKLRLAEDGREPVGLEPWGEYVFCKYFELA